MSTNSIRSWRALALKANVHLGTARILLDLALESAQQMPEATAQQLRGAAAETIAAQDFVRQLGTS
jgi:hypothetical protein